MQDVAYAELKPLLTAAKQVVDWDAAKLNPKRINEDDKDGRYDPRPDWKVTW